jgi:hypothetical protein
VPDGGLSGLQAAAERPPDPLRESARAAHLWQLTPRYAGSGWPAGCASSDGSCAAASAAAVRPPAWRVLGCTSSGAKRERRGIDASDQSASQGRAKGSGQHAQIQRGQWSARADPKRAVVSTRRSKEGRLAGLDPSPRAAQPPRVALHPLPHPTPPSSAHRRPRRCLHLSHCRPAPAGPWPAAPPGRACRCCRRGSRAARSPGESPTPPPQGNQTCWAAGQGRAAHGRERGAG